MFRLENAAVMEIQNTCASFLTNENFWSLTLRGDRSLRHFHTQFTHWEECLARKDEDVGDSFKFSVNTH